MASGQPFFAPIQFDELYRVAVGAWGIPPSDFWTMTHREFWWMFDVRKPPPKKVGRSSFTEREVRELAKMQRELKERRRGERSAGDPREVHGGHA
jgi:hypothetical protein